MSNPKRPTVHRATPDQNHRWPRLARAIVLSAAAVFPGITTVIAESAFAPPNWTQEGAWSAAAEVDTVAELKPLFDLARTGQDEQLLIRLRQLESNTALPVPAREYILQTFAQGLSDLPARQPSSELAAYLLSFRPRTMVPHEEYAAAGTPLFNVAAAATGSFNAWERQSGADEASRILGKDPSAWVAAWLAAPPPRRDGFEEALLAATPDQVLAVGVVATGRLPASPELGPVLGLMALRLAKPDWLTAALVQGHTVGLARTLRSATGVFDAAEQAEVLTQATNRAPAANAAVAIAELGPGLLNRPEVESLLFALLGDEQLGSAAALVLSRAQEPGTWQKLQEIAATGSGLAARRAALAESLANPGSAQGPRR